MLPITPTDFTPWASLGGGVLLGISAVMLMALFGRIAAGVLRLLAGCWQRRYCGCCLSVVFRRKLSVII